MLTVDTIQVADIGDRVDTEQKHVQDGEQHRHDAQSNRDGRHDREGGQRRAPACSPRGFPRRAPLVSIRCVR
jgi:hypothetical protein